jgi:hypothetical protein
MVRTEGDETFNYLSVVSASEKEYVSYGRIGADPSPAASARQTATWTERAAQRSMGDSMPAGQSRS